MKTNKLYIKVLIKGKNLQNVPEIFRLSSINVYNFKQNEKTCKVVVDYKDRHKIFAICKNMCYNIKIYGYKGLYAPLMAALINIGLTIGAAVFVVLCGFLNGYILKIEYTGSGASVSSASSRIISDYGVSLYDRFSNINLKSLESELLNKNPYLEFVTVKKSGVKLIIDSVLTNGEVKENRNKNGDLVCDVDGVVFYAETLSGTQLVNKGDSVSKNSVLVGAYMIGKDGEKYPSQVITKVVVLYKKTKIIKCEIVNENVIKSAVKAAQFAESDETEFYTVTEIEGGISVELTLKREYCGG